MSKILPVAAILLLGLSTSPIVASEPPAAPWERVECTPGGGRQSHDFADSSRPGLHVHVDLLCASEDAGVATVLPTDCSSSAYVKSGYRWTGTYSFLMDASKSGLSASGALAAFSTSAATWDQETNASLFSGGALGGSAGRAGRSDGVNQIGWKSLAVRTIAQTTTWYLTATHVAVESDGAYNVRYAWSLSGEANRMDLQNIATHEIGHTYGLSHPSDVAANSCLTMYPTADYGETQKRTLGDGDILGIRSVYGN